jgi:hypothetical protein
MAREDKIQRALEWARGMRGKHVPNSKHHECWDLPEEALKRHGLVTSTTLTPKDGDFRKADYVWGEQVKERDTRPGDIIQFRNHVVKKTTKAVITFPDGSYREESRWEEQKRPHHTAIANGAFNAADGTIDTLELNVRPDPTVVQNKTLYTQDVNRAPVTRYEMRKNPKTKKTERVTVQTTVTYEVTYDGLWVYRPMEE